ncbi:MAG TPA: hypothetical protein DCQ30_15150, partial [Acidimicrobiaceae bacterium]|nr:hypothetical protein [Acidimicrobiaceae bacterium]
LNPLIKVMNLVSLLILPVVITLRHNNGARYGIAAASLVVLLSAIAFSKRKSEGFGAEEDAPVEPLQGAPVNEQVSPPAASAGLGA